MKKSLIPFLALALLYVTATAQGEWKWAHYWTGQDGSYNAYYNYITNTAFDDEGNLYVYGAMGNNPVMDGEPFEFYSGAPGMPQNNPSILLTKFDTLGNMLWSKVVKQSSCAAVPHWMEIKEDRVCIAGSTGFMGDGLYQWLYFLDTLITKEQIMEIPTDQRKPPFKEYSRWTFFAEFDFDGNLLENHFVEVYAREENGTRVNQPLCNGSAIAPVHFDRNGNVFFYTAIQYGGNEESPYTLVIDGDSSRFYDIFLPGSVEPYGAINNAMFYKFSSDWTLEFAHLLVDHTDGIATSYEFTGDSVNPIFYFNLQGLSCDDEDGMYLSGYINLALCSPNYGGYLHDYPVHFYWDDTHFLSVHDITSATGANFIVKFNKEGQIVWCNQLYTEGDVTTVSSYAGAFWNRCVFRDNSVYITGTGCYGMGEDARIYFDDEENLLQRFQPVKSDISFYVRYNAMTGQYITHGIVPAAQAVAGNAVTSISNRVLAYSNVDFNMRILNEWGNDGTYIKSDTLISSNPLTVSEISCNDYGYIAVGMTSFSPVSFGNGISVNCSTEQSSAVIAMKYDPELLVPYVKVPEYQGPKPEVRLWPNPATDKITIESEADFPIKSIAITDLQGRLLTVLPGNGVRHTLNIHKLPVGTYIAHIETKAGITDVKFVKGE